MHGHPQSVSSWQEEAIQKSLREDAASKVLGDQCRYGLTSTDGVVTGVAKKRIGFVTDSVRIAWESSRWWPNTMKIQVHQHIRLENGRARAAQEYPNKLCRAICEGLIKQIGVGRKGQFLMVDYDAEKLGASRKL